MGFEPTTSCLGSKHSTAELHPPIETSKTRLKVTGYSESSQKFTSQLLNDFITSRTSGTTQKTITLYHFASRYLVRSALLKRRLCSGCTDIDNMGNHFDETFPNGKVAYIFGNLLQLLTLLGWKLWIRYENTVRENLE